MCTAKYGKADIVRFTFNGIIKEGIIFSTNVELIYETKTEHAKAMFVYKVKVYDKFSLTPTFLNVNEDNIIEQL